MLINGRLIAAETGADIDVVEHFSLIHDILREDEGSDIHHGNRAADYVKLMSNDWVHLNSEQLEQLVDMPLSFHGTVDARYYDTDLLGCRSP